MGRILFIRVSAVTYREEEVIRAWPLLCATVWPDPEIDDADSPAKIVRKLVPAPERGALELVDRLTDMVQFGELQPEWKTALQVPAATLASLREQLDEALGDRKVAEAQTLTGRIEGALDEAEALLQTLKGY